MTTATRSSTLWTTYTVVYCAGIATLLNLSRTPAAGWLGLLVPFAFPLILVALAVVADRAEAQEPAPPPLGPVSVVTGLPTLHRQRPRTISAVGMSMGTPFAKWLLPEGTSPAIVVVLMIVMLSCAAFTAFVVPRLQPRVEPDSGLDLRR